MRTTATLLFVVVWFIHLIVGIGAGYAALRLWHSRHHPLIRRVGLYMNAFIIDVLGAIVLLFVARGVTLTWKFSSVLFASTLLGDLLRAPLILYLIRGPAKEPVLPHPPETSGGMPPRFWLDAFRVIVREEIAQMIPNEKDKDRPDQPTPPVQPQGPPDKPGPLGDVPIPPEPPKPPAPPDQPEGE